MDSLDDPQRVFGWIAVSLSLVYKLPQIIHLYRTQNTAGIAVSSQIVQASAYFFYVTHGFIISDPPIIFLGFTSLLQSLVLVFQFYLYHKPENENDKLMQDEEDKDSANINSRNGDDEGKQQEMGPLVATAV
jgi:uncharacterized protein with PQ loop repeat